MPDQGDIRDVRAWGRPGRQGSRKYASSRPAHVSWLVSRPACRKNSHYSAYKENSELNSPRQIYSRAVPRKGRAVAAAKHKVLAQPLHFAQPRQEGSISAKSGIIWRNNFKEEEKKCSLLYFESCWSVSRRWRGPGPPNYLRQAPLAPLLYLHSSPALTCALHGGRPRTERRAG